MLKLESQFHAVLDFPADHCPSRVLRKAVRAEMARLVGKGMQRREEQHPIPVVLNLSFLYELLTTPLMLHVIMLAYQGQAVEDLPQLGTPQEQQRYIFASYLQRMLPSLVWLAQQMRQRSQSILYLEQLQPDWLAGPGRRLLYQVSVGLVSGLLSGLDCRLNAFSDTLELCNRIVLLGPPAEKDSELASWKAGLASVVNSTDGYSLLLSSSLPAIMTS